MTHESTRLPAALAAEPPRATAEVRPHMVRIEGGESTRTVAVGVTAGIALIVAGGLAFSGNSAVRWVAVCIVATCVVAYAFVVRVNRREHRRALAAATRGRAIPATVTAVRAKSEKPRDATRADLCTIEVRAAEEPMLASVRALMTPADLGEGAMAWIFAVEPKRGVVWIPPLGLLVCRVSTAEPLG